MSWILKLYWPFSITGDFALTGSLASVLCCVLASVPLPVLHILPVLICYWCTASDFLLRPLQGNLSLCFIIFFHTKVGERWQGKGKLSFHLLYSQCFWYEMCGLFPSPINSLTPARQPIIQLNSDTTYLELASDPASSGLSPTRLPPPQIPVASLGFPYFWLNSHKLGVPTIIC